MKITETQKQAIGGAVIVIAGGFAAYLLSKKNPKGFITPQEAAQNAVQESAPGFTPANYTPVAPVIDLGDTPSYMTYNLPPSLDLGKLAQAAQVVPPVAPAGGGCAGCGNDSCKTSQYTPFPPAIPQQVANNQLQALIDTGINPNSSYFGSGGVGIGGAVV